MVSIKIKQIQLQYRNNEYTKFYQTLIIEGQQRMIDNFSQLALKKYHSSSYRHSIDQSTMNPVLEINTEQYPKTNNNPKTLQILQKSYKQNINPDQNPKSSKNINTIRQDSQIKKNNYSILGHTLTGDSLTNSCYFARDRQPYNNTRWDSQKYQYKQQDKIQIVINAPVNQQFATPILKNKYSINSRTNQRHSHFIQPTLPLYYQYTDYKQYKPNNTNYLNFPSNDQVQRLRETTSLANQYSSYEVGCNKNELQVCKTSRNRPNYQKVRNSNIVGERFNFSTNFPYTSSVTYSQSRQGLMGQVSGQSRIHERIRQNSNYKNDQTLKYTLQPTKLDDSYQKRNRSRSRVQLFNTLQLDDFNIGQCKGQGRFGKVYIAIHKKTGFLCALKKVKKQSVKYMMEQFIQEMKIQLFLNHPKLVKLYGYFSDVEHIYMLIQYMEDGSLYSLMKKNKKIDEPETIEKLRQICEGVKQMHDNNIVHRDLKPENVVMTHGVCKVCDFGWATICQDRRQTYCGTLDYVCPEIIQGNSYDSGVDVWCIGVLAYELMCGKAPFYDISRKKTMQKIKSCKIQNFPSHLSREAIRFIEMILTKDPEERTGIQELLDSDFLKEKKQ